MSSEPRSVNHVEFRCPKCDKPSWQLPAAVISHVCKKNKERETFFVRSDQ